MGCLLRGWLSPPCDTVRQSDVRSVLRLVGRRCSGMPGIHISDGISDGKRHMRTSPSAESADATVECRRELKNTSTHEGTVQKPLPDQRTIFGSHEAEAFLKAVQLIPSPHPHSPEPSVLLRIDSRGHGHWLAGALTGQALALGPGGKVFGRFYHQRNSGRTNRLQSDRPAIGGHDPQTHRL
jgi:hypothetical protein